MQDVKQSHVEAVEDQEYLMYAGVKQSHVEAVADQEYMMYAGCEEVTCGGSRRSGIPDVCRM